jgi:hypothetical protein
MESGFQSSLHLIRMCIHRWKNRIQGKVLQSPYSITSIIQ